MAQEKGFVSANLEAVIIVRLANDSEIECAVDTAFNGAFLFPKQVIQSNKV